MSHLKTIIISFIGILAILCGCTPASLKRSFAEADRLMENHPDSALMILCKIDTAEIKTERDRARYLLLLTQARYKNYVEDKSDSVISFAVDYYDKHTFGNKERCILAHYYRGVLLANDSQLKLAMKDALAANQLATETKNNDLKAKTSDLFADIYYTAFDLKKAYEHRILTAHYYRLADNATCSAIAMIEAANALSGSNRIAEASQILDSLSNLEIAHIPNINSLIRESKIFLNVKAKRYREAVKLYEEEKVFCRKNNLEFTKDPYAAIAMAKTGRQEEAQKTVDSLETAYPDFAKELRFSKVKYELAMVKGDVYAALQNCDSMFERQNRLVIDAFRRDASHIESNFYKNLTIEKEKQFFRNCIFFGIIITIGAIHFFARKRKYKKEVRRMGLSLVALNTSLKTKEHFIKTQNDLILQKDQLIDSHLIENEKMKIKLDGKDELLAKLFNETFANLRELASAYFSIVDNPREKEEVKKRFEKIYKEMTSEKSLNHIVEKVNQYKDNVLGRMQNALPKLKNVELFSTALIIIGFTPAQVALTLNIEISNYYNIWSRLKKKLEKLPELRDEILSLCPHKN